MRYALLVEAYQGLHYLTEDLGRYPLREPFLRLLVQDLLQNFSIHVLQDQVELPLRVDGVEQSHDVGVATAEVSLVFEEIDAVVGGYDGHG